MDIYHDELQTWTTLVAMTPLERAAWRREKLGRLEGRELPVKSALSTNEFTALTVKDIVQVTEDSLVYTISLPDGRCLGYQPGQHCILRGFVDSSECSVTRQYTPISPPDEDGSFAVLIKLYKDGRVSEVIRAWAVGTVTEWKGPFGGLNYKPNKYRHIGMLACGTGIAPMIQVIRTIIENEADDTFIHLVYSSSTQHTVLLKKELDKYTAYWNFRSLYVLSKASEQDTKADPGLMKYGDKVHYGRLDCEVVGREMPRACTESHVLICGTRSFDKDMINHLSKIGYSKNMYHKF